MKKTRRIFHNLLVVIAIDQRTILVKESLESGNIVLLYD